MTGWKKLLLPVSALVLILMITCLPGCDLFTSSATQDKGILTTRYQDIGGGRPPSVDHFGAGELPVVYVYGYGGETVTVEVYDVSTGESVQGANFKTYTIPNKMNASWEYPNLPSGTYKAVLWVGGTQVKFTTFSVYK